MRHRARGLRVTLAWEPATARGSSRVADRLPTLAAAQVPKSTGGVPVRTELQLGGADTQRSLLPPVRSRCILSFTSPFAVPARPRERTECTGRQMFGPDCQGSLGWVTQAARCFGCRTESSRSTTTEPSQTTSLRLLRSRRLVVSQVAMLANRHLPLACTLSSQA